MKNFEDLFEFSNEEINKFGIRDTFQILNNIKENCSLRIQDLITNLESKRQNNWNEQLT